MNWIRCSDRYPGIGRRVIVWCAKEQKSYIVTGYVKDLKLLRNGEIMCLPEDITHWMELPSSPTDHFEK